MSVSLSCDKSISTEFLDMPFSGSVDMSGDSGAFLSIHDTSATTFPSLPAASMNLNVNDPLLVNVYAAGLSVLDMLVIITVFVSFVVSVAVTVWLVV